MIVTLELEPEVELTATEQAKEKGLPLDEYVKSVVKEAIFKRQRIRNYSAPLSERLSPDKRTEIW